MASRRVKPWERRRCARACDNCKRRKERCDGRLPCGRCTKRQVIDQCSFSRSPRALNSPVSSRDNVSSDSFGLDIGPLDPLLLDTSSIHHPTDVQGTLHSTPTPSRPNADNAADYVSDSANISFLQVVRNLVRESLGPCQFAQDTPESVPPEKTPATQPGWALDAAKQPPERPEPAEAHYLTRWYLRATNCIVTLIDEQELHDSLSEWLRAPADELSYQPQTAIFFLIFAIGCQTCPENRDDTAEKYFNYGRFLNMSHMEVPSVSTVQAHALITMYLLGASRREAAFMYLGPAVRAGYALGIHQRNTNAQYDNAEYRRRERLWKTLRILDLFLSASLGHPPSTCETRDTGAQANYSAATDLCVIFEVILTNVYSRRAMSKDALEKISQRHRRWSKRFTTGLAADDIEPTEFIETDEGGKAPNLGLYHIKEAYYWTIMLLARPFLVQSMSKRVSKAAESNSFDECPTSRTSLGHVVSHACVDSAIRTVDLLSGLKSSEHLPKRLPFVVNFLFVASLVLGLAQFGDLDCVFPLGKSLARARKLLSLFQCDAGSRRNLATVDNLRAACDLYLEKRSRRKMERQSLLIRGLFGVVHEGQDPLGGEVDPRAASMRPIFGLVPATESQDNTGDADSIRCADVSNTQEYLNFGVEGMMPDFAAMAASFLPISPRALLSDPEAPLSPGSYNSALNFDILAGEAMMGENWT
ncbi:hypothetical protein ACJ41O_010552 [Fusarium nematophilum]